MAQALLSRDAENIKLIEQRTERAAAELERRGIDPAKQPLVLEAFEKAVSLYVSRPRRGVPIQTSTGNTRSVNLAGDVFTFDIVEALANPGIRVGRVRNGGLASALDGIGRCGSG